jgi:hypothetical protein
MQQSALLDNIPADYDDLSEGVAVSFPILGIRGGKFWLRWKGEEQLVTIPGTPHPAPFVDVVILKAQKDLTRTFYAGGYVEGAHERPDCWSSNGVKPDDGVPNPVNPVCGSCPNAEWGSSNNAAAPRAQACQQRRRTIIVPYSDDLTNDEEGGPVLLSVPPGSLTNQLEYGKELKDNRIHYFGCVTRLSFDTDKAFPKLEFQYIQPLNDVEVQTVLGVREGDGVKRIITSRINVDGPEVDDARPAPAQAPAQRAPTGGSAVRPPQGQAPTQAPAQRQIRAPAPPQQPVAPPPAVKQQPAPSMQLVQPAQPAQRVGGFAARPARGTIAGAVAQPAAPPASKRTVVTPPAQQAAQEPPPPTEADMEGEAMEVGPDELTDRFGALMGGK